MRKLIFGILLLATLVGYGQNVSKNDKVYESSYESLKNYSAPEWYEDAKIGFWVHWGIYSVPAFAGDHAA